MEREHYEPITLPDCCFYPKWVPTTRKTKTERAWKCYNCWEVKWMPLDFKLDQMSEKISESTKRKKASKNMI